MDYKAIAQTVQELQTQVKEHSQEFFWFISQDVNRDSVGWPLLILSKLESIDSKLDPVLEAVGDGIDAVIETHSLVQSLLDSLNRSPKQMEVEKRFGKPIQALLEERQGHSLRTIANELGIGRGTAANWLKQFGLHPAGGGK